MAKQPIEFVTPVGRLVAGNPYEPKTEDSDGKPLVGRDKVTPRVEYFVGIAIPKGGEQHWAQTDWGQKLWAAGHAGYPNAGNLGRNFSWKLTDGDSQEPNKKGVKPCDREGYPGHWVLYFSSGYAPKICNKDGSQQILEKDAVKPGYFIQIAGSVVDNSPAQSPGIYLNLQAIALTAYGPEIAQKGSVDTTKVGFGANVQLPAGASTVPPAGAFNPAPVPAYQPPVPVPVVPNPAALGMPAPTPPAIPVPVPAPVTVPPPPAVAALVPVPPAHQMTPAANGVAYEAYIAQGWTDALLRQHGMML